jgi:hypothetical protein
MRANALSLSLTLSAPFFLFSLVYKCCWGSTALVPLRAGRMESHAARQIIPCQSVSFHRRELDLNLNYTERATAEVNIPLLKRANLERWKEIRSPTAWLQITERVPLVRSTE